jgi:hypothetical protein
MADLLDSIKLKLESIKDLISLSDDNCFQYYFVKDDELTLLKTKIHEIPKHKFSELKKLSYIDISTPKIEEEFNELIDSKFKFIEGLTANESTDIQFRNIIINKDDHNASYGLHQEFNNFSERNMFSILYYFNIDNCDLSQCGTGIVFIDKFGKRRYEILPVYPGLIIVLRDKCMFHHTPNIKPIDESKPIIRTLIRKYIGFDRFENDKNVLLKSIDYNFLNKTIIKKKMDDLNEKILLEQCKTFHFHGEQKDRCEKYKRELILLNEEYEKLNDQAVKINQIESVRNKYIMYSDSESNSSVNDKYFKKYITKYIKYKTKYIKLLNKINH